MHILAMEKRKKKAAEKKIYKYNIHTQKLGKNIKLNPKRTEKKGNQI